MGDDGKPRTLYVGNLNPAVTEGLLVTLFGTMGSCIGCKIIHEAGNDLYAFVEFADHRSAQMALMSMNKRTVLDREMKVNWATSPGSHGKQDTSNHFHVFVGDLSPDIETRQLREAFAPFGEISDCKVIRDTQTQLSKGFGFVSFVRKEDAENAIIGLNGQWLGNKPIRTNWATRKPAVPTHREGSHKTLRYEDVYNQSSTTNCTVYCGGIMNGLTEELMHETFARFGEVQETRVFKEKGFAFIRFDSKKAATEAIVATHGAEINGVTVKCSWGKETDASSTSTGQSSASVTQAAPPSFGGQQYGGPSASYYNPMGYYGYPQQYPPPMPGYGPPPQPFMQGYGYGYPGYGAAQWGGASANQSGHQQHQQYQSGMGPTSGSQRQ